MPDASAIMSLENPVFQTYVVAASIMILKLMLQPWMTVIRINQKGQKSKGSVSIDPNRH